MLKFVYLHGFNSGAGSRSARELTALLRREVFAPGWDYGRPFHECLAWLEDSVLEFQGGPQNGICLMGSSLGGFYALQLRKPRIARVIAWNPVIYPVMQLARFLGANTRFSDGAQWDFREDSLYSYAGAPDPRDWLNPYARSPGQMPGTDATQDGICPERLVIIGERDDLLNPHLCRAYWHGHARLEAIDAGHSVEDYGHVLNFIN